MIFDVSFDPCLKGFNFPNFFDTDEKNVAFLGPPPPLPDDVVVIPAEPVFCRSVMYIFIFNNSVLNSSFFLANDTSCCT
ncbi:hypothetical protein FF1_005741 [Malus domestica]